MKIQEHIDTRVQSFKYSLSSLSFNNYVKTVWSTRQLSKAVDIEMLSFCIP